MSSEESLTVEILRQIRGEVVKTNERLEHLETSVDNRLSETNRRLDFLAEGQTRLYTEVAGLKGEVGGLRGEVGGLRGEVGGLRGEVVELRASVDRNGDRFEHFLHTNGDAIRDLRERMGRVEEHIGLT